MRSLLVTRISYLTHNDLVKLGVTATLIICAIVLFGLEKTKDLPRTDRIGQLIEQIEVEEARDAYHASMGPTYCRLFGEC